MSFQVLPETPVPPGSQCASHADGAAQSACRRCGGFVCASCSRELGGLRFCASCAERDDVNYLEGTRKRFWGKRDVWAWLFAFSIPRQLLALGLGVAAMSWSASLIALASLALLVPYVMLRPWARKTIFLLAVTSLLNGFMDVDAAGLDADVSMVRGVVVGSTVVFLLFAWAAYASPRNRLAFRLPVSDAQLQQLYDTHVANPLARRAAAYGTLSLLVPVFGPLTLWMSWAAFRKARDATFPPVHGAGLARVGLVTSAISTLLLVVTIVLLVFVVEKH